VKISPAFLARVNLFWKLIGFEPYFLMKRVALFLETGMRNPTSNFMWSNVQFISIERYQKWALCRSFRPLQRPKKRLIGVPLNVGNSFQKKLDVFYYVQ
jgi:hypothetical protein